MQPFGRGLRRLDRERLQAVAEQVLAGGLQLLRLRADPFARGRDQERDAVGRQTVEDRVHEIGQRQSLPRHLPREREARQPLSAAGEVERVGVRLRLEVPVHRARPDPARLLDP